jgi:phospholipid/cholesterol/gamma-HCH transport system substrate-binding protein
MTDLKEVTAKGREVLADPQLSADVRASVGNVRKITEQGIELMDSADEALTTLNNVTSVLRPKRVLGDAQLLGIGDQGLRADLWSDYYTGADGGFWRLGVRDIGDDEGLIFQRAFGLGARTDMRAGFYDSRLALGLDHSLSSRLSIGLDAWDPDDPRLEVRGRFGLSDGLDLTFGATDVFTGTDPFIGIGYRLWDTGDTTKPAPATKPADAAGPGAPPAP